MNKKAALTEDPASAIHWHWSLWNYDVTRTNNSANLSNATDLVSDIGADSNGDIYNYYDSAMAE
jgi:hypothetical protein